MKQVFVVALSIFLFAIAGCSDDDDGGRPANTPTTIDTPTATAATAATRTGTGTATLTRTPTITVTLPPSRTATLTATPEPTFTATREPTFTATLQPTFTPTPEPTLTATVEPTLTATATPTTTPHTAPEQPVLAFDEAAAVAANGDYPAADPKTVCGADDRRFLAELTQGSPTQYKVPLRLADIKASPSEMMVSGVAKDVSLGGGDFPFDHTFGSDLNFDVVLDAPFTNAAQRRGIVEGDMHIELAEGQLPHEARAPGPPTGQEWEEMSRLSREGIFLPFVPDADSRVIVMGHWIVDCGHTNFQTELHPITFAANARVTGEKTVVHAFYNPYRETQLYNLDPAKALAFDDPSRFDLPASGSFPAQLITSVLRIQDLGPAPYQSIDHLESWAMLEPNRTSPVAWHVCAPGGSSGTRMVVKYHWITRPGVQIDVTPDDASSCAIVRSTLDTETIAAPMPRVCVTPWDFLNEVAGEEAGIPDLDLQAQIGAFVAPQFKNRLDPAPILNCYDPLQGPALESEPTGQLIEVNDDLLLPFYGSISVELGSD